MEELDSYTEIKNILRRFNRRDYGGFLEFRSTVPWTFGDAMGSDWEARTRMGGGSPWLTKQPGPAFERPAFESREFLDADNDPRTAGDLPFSEGNSGDCHRRRQYPPMCRVGRIIGICAQWRGMKRLWEAVLYTTF